MKDHIVNTRVPEDLYKKISRKASKQKKTISSYVHDLIAQSLQTPADIDKTINKKENFTHENKIIGYQEFIIADDTNCRFCSKKIKAGKKAYFLIKNSGPKPDAVVCPKCQKK